MNEYTRKQIENKTIALDILLTQHCNLRCRGCSRYSCLAKPRYYDIDYLKRDLSVLSKYKVTNLTFTGGEPLLYPRQWLIEILEYARKLFPDTGISIFTNGKILVSSDLWNVFKENNIGITYTKYSLSNIDYDEIAREAEKHGVLCKNLSEYTNTHTTLENKTEMYLFRLSMNETKTLEMKKQECSGDCPVLWDSKIYQCGTVAFVDILNSHYKSNFIANKHDFLSIHDFTIEKYHDFISKCSPFCRYCSNVDNEKIKWSQDKPQKGDYIA